MNEKSAELKELCETIYEDIKKFAREHADETTGCNFTYTPEKSWSAEKKILLLTVNPHAEPNEEPCIPDLPWPDENAFLAEDSKFGIKDRILTILSEIAKHKTGNPYIASSCVDEGLRRFVDDNIILASYVPFRTPGEADITDAMWEFAHTSYWSKILHIWQPELIVTTGNRPYNAIKRCYRQMSKRVAKAQHSRVSDYHGTDVIPPSSGHYHICNCRFPIEKSTYLLGVPHPANHKKEKGRSTNWGYPDPRIFHAEAPIQKFLNMALKSINF